MKWSVYGLAAILACATAGTVQAQVKEGSNWRRVLSLPVGTRVEIQVKTTSTRCALTSVTEDGIACSSKAGKLNEFARQDVRRIRIGHRTRSTLAGAGVVGGAMAIASFTALTGGTDQSFFGKNFLRGPGTAVGALGGAVIGSAIGAVTDFTRSTVYKAP